MSLSDYELRVLAELEHELEAMGRRGESVRRADRWRRVVARSWVVVSVVLFGVAVVAPSVAVRVWVAVGTAVVLAGAAVLASGGVRTLKDLRRG